MATKRYKRDFQELEARRRRGRRMLARGVSQAEVARASRSHSPNRDDVGAIVGRRCASVATPTTRAARFIRRECHLARGENAQALNAYRRCRELLSIVLGVRPSSRTEALMSRITGR